MYNYIIHINQDENYIIYEIHNPFVSVIIILYTIINSN